MEMKDRESAGTDYVLAMLGALLLAACLLRKTERYGDDAVGTRTFSPEKAESRTRWNGPNTGPGPERGLPSRPPRYLIQKTQCEGCRTRRLHELLDDGEFLSAPPKGQNTTLTHSPGRISRDSSVRRAANEGHSSNKAFALELDPGAPTMERYISKLELLQRPLLKPPFGPSYATSCRRTEISRFPRLVVSRRTMTAKTA
ncbi:hypothetical protein CSPX01_15882 [Colletotrichum filicis]|nr:hypothetical protein CSPX01_15882 [Colletotrichum filicis]